MVCCLSLALYSFSSVLKAVNDYSTLVISSILASCSSYGQKFKLEMSKKASTKILFFPTILTYFSLLVFSSAQAWYNHEHVETHDFPMEWISETLEKVSFWSGVLSVFGGVMAYILAELISAKASAPFMASVPLLILGLCMCWSNWTENKSLNRQTKFAKSCMNGLKEIVQNRSVLLCGILQALFEAVISIFVFLWLRIKKI